MDQNSIRSMFKVYCVIIAFLLVTACNDSESPEEQRNHVGVVRPVGDVTGAGETFDVNADGAILKSADGNIEINIPPGALSTATTIGIQAIQNTAPNGIGHAYRLTPEGVSFNKPVVITLNYSENVSFADGLAIAFQADDGIWYWPGNLDHDKTGRQLKVETSHFSDWSLFESMYLLPSETAIATDEVIELTALRVLPPDAEDDLLTPLVFDEPLPLGEPVPLEETYIKEWKLIGVGTLEPSGDVATYTAPSDIPENNPETVTLEVNLRNGSKAFLLSYITIAGCQITVNGGPYDHASFSDEGTAMPAYLEEIDVTTISFYAADVNGEEIGVVIFFPGQTTGQFPFADESCFVTTFQVINGSKVDGITQIEDNPPIMHAGFVEITKYDKEQMLIIGNFSGGFSIGEFCLPDPCISHGTVEGSFIASVN